MTTIALKVSRDRITIAGDSQMTDESGLITSGMVKIHRVKNNLIGFAGAVDACHLFLDWFERGADPKEGASLFQSSTHDAYDFTALVVNNQLLVYTIGRLLVPCPENQPIVAIGSGAGIALGAMAMGASPKKAVEVAAKFDLFTGGEVRSLSIARRKM